MNDPEAYVFTEAFRTVYAETRDHDHALFCAHMAVFKFRESQRFRKKY